VTQTAGNNSTNVATTAFVATAISGAAVAANQAWTPADYSFISWSLDPALVLGGSSPTAGQLYLVRLHIPACTITNIVMGVSTAGVSLTAGQNFGVLYDASRTLLAITADQSTAWTTTGMKNMALASAQTVAAGDYYVGFWGQGTTMPQFLRGATQFLVNGNMTAATARFVASSSGLTTTAPATASTGAANSNAWWVAVS
jgi:hypothetical protein